MPEYAALQPPKVPPKPRSRVTQTLPHSEHPSDATPLQQHPLWEGRRAEQSAQTQTRAQTPTARRCAEAEYADLPSSPSPPSRRSAVLVMRRMLLRLREVEEHISEVNYFSSVLFLSTLSSLFYLCPLTLSSFFSSFLDFRCLTCACILLSLVMSVL